MTPDKGHYIADLPRSGQVQLQAAVQSVSVKQKKDGSDYLSLTLADKTGSIEAKIWDEADKAAPLCLAGTIINVAGVVDIYKDQLQLTIKRLLVTGPYELADFIPASKYDPETMLSDIGKCINIIQDPDIRTLLWTAIGNNTAALLQSPAARKNHHAWAGGLLEHIRSMCKAAIMLCKHYEDVNRDLLLAGVILHDFAKIEEFSVGLTFNYTDRGKLLGHIPMGINNVRRYAPESMSEVTIRHLEHLVASHHGQLEWGATVKPATLEAILLHNIDMIDAQITMARQLIERMPADAEWTEYSPQLGASIWVPRVKVTEVESVEAQVA